MGSTLVYYKQNLSKSKDSTIRISKIFGFGGTNGNHSNEAPDFSRFSSGSSYLRVASNLNIHSMKNEHSSAKHADTTRI